MAALILASLAVTPALAACNSPVGSTSVRDVAWVTTAASLTLPGTALTPVDLATRRPGAKVPIGSLPAAWILHRRQPRSPAVSP